MKYLLFFFFFPFLLSIGHAGHPEKIGILSSKVILQNGNGYFVLCDGSCWKAICFNKRWRTLSEWWNGVDLVPDQYENYPKDWYLGTPIEIFSKHDSHEAKESNASNENELKQCTHLMVNTRTGYTLFVISMHPADCIIQLFNDAHEDGYNKGIEEAKKHLNVQSSNSYRAGYTEGYKAGYVEGVNRTQMSQVESNPN